MSDLTHTEGPSTQNVPTATSSVPVVDIESTPVETISECVTPQDPHTLPAGGPLNLISAPLTTPSVAPAAEAVASVPTPAPGPLNLPVPESRPVGAHTHDYPATGTGAPATIPGGIIRRLVGPVDDRYVRCFRTYTSGRGFTTAISRPDPAVRPLRVEYLHDPIDTFLYDMSHREPSTARMNIDVTEVPLDPEEYTQTYLGVEVMFRVRSEQVDLRRFVYGTTKGVPRTARVVGTIAIRDRTTHISATRGGDIGRRMLTVAPAYANAVGMVTDENVLKSQRLILSAFPEVPRETTSIGAVFPRCGELRMRGVNPTRFIFRLATLFVYSRFATAAGFREASIMLGGELPSPMDIGKWVTWERAVRDAPGDEAYIPWLPFRARATMRDERYCHVLSAAAAGRVKIGLRGREAGVVCWPSIGRRVRILCVGHLPSAQLNLVIDPEFIYEVGYLWCARYGDVALFKEMIDLVALMYWETRGANCMLGAPHGEITLPESDTVGYLLAPMLQDMDRMDVVNLHDYDVPLSHHMAHTVALRATTLQWVRWYAQYPLVDAALEKGLVVCAADEEAVYEPLRRESPGLGAPIWRAIQYVWTNLGLKGELGRFVTSTACSMEVGEYRDFLRGNVLHRLSGFDMLGIIPTLPPDLCVAGWVKPPPIPFLFEQNETYLLEDFARAGHHPQHVLRTLMEVKGVQAIAVVASRHALSVKNVKAPFLQLDARGLPRDHQLHGFCLPDGSRLQYAVRVRSAFATGVINDPKHDRYNLDWWEVPFTPKRDFQLQRMYGVFEDPPAEFISFRDAYGEFIEGKRATARLADQVVNQLFHTNLPTELEHDTLLDSTVQSEEELVPRNRRLWPPPRCQAPRHPYRRDWPDDDDSFGGPAPPPPPAPAAPASDPPAPPPRASTPKGETPQHSPDTSYQEPWDNDAVERVSKTVPLDVALKLKQMDAASVAECTKEFTEAVAKCVNSYYTNIRALPAVGKMCRPGVLSADFDVLQKYNMEVLLGVRVPDRAEYLFNLASLVETTLAGYPDRKSMEPAEKKIAMWRVCANHMLFNPSLTPEGYLDQQETLQGTSLAMMILNGKLTAKDVLTMVVTGQSPFGPCEPPSTDKTYSQLLVNAMRWIDNYCIQIVHDDSLRIQELDIWWPLDDAFPHIKEKLSSEELGILTQKVTEVTIMMEQQRLARQARVEAEKGFGPRERRPPETDDEEGAAEGGGGTGTASRGTDRRTSVTQTPRRFSSAGGSRKSTRGTRQRCCMPEQWKKHPQAEVLHYLMRGCPRSLQFQYGGPWPDSGSTQTCAELCTPDRAKSWWNRLSPRSQARYMVYSQFSVAGKEHFQELFSTNLPAEDPLFAVDEWERLSNLVRERLLKGEDVSGEQGNAFFCEFVRQVEGEEDCQRKSDFPPIKLHGGMPIVMTAGIVLETYPMAQPIIELLHNRSPTSDEYEVATTAFALLAMPMEIKMEIACQRWFRQPLEEWHKIYKDVIVRAKRSCIFGRSKGDSVLHIRKFLNCTIRRKEEPPMDVEFQNRCYSTTPKKFFAMRTEDRRPGHGPREEYMHRFKKVAVDHWRKVLGKWDRKNAPETMEAAWAKRAITGPAGASTIIKGKKELLQQLDLSPNDRPGKKVVIEMLPSTFLQDNIVAKPVNRANFFVKPEPGKKLRALYSSHDVEMFMAGYASQGQEKAMDAIPGVMVRQTPHDVLDWMAQSDGGVGTAQSQNRYWMSVDYSDYNSEHTLQELATVHAALGVAREEAGWCMSSQGGKEKVAANAWVAESFMESWVCWGQRSTEGCHLVPADTGWCWTDGTCFSKPMPKEEAEALAGRKVKMWSRVFNGLFSGHRDTARDNTFIHAIDVEIARQTFEYHGLPWDATFVALCGDDEDIQFGHPLTAVWYYNMLGPAGHALNPVKQLAGREHHEFLQLNWVKGGRVEKPLCALLSTLGTGNWYTQLGLWIQSAIEACIANWWEAYCRGVPLGEARRACASYLDRLMVLPAEMCADTEWAETGKRLEWWAFRGQPTFAPLFSNTGRADLRIPKFEAAPDVTASWPNSATDDYVKTQRNLLDRLPQRCEKELREVIALDTVGTALKTWRQRRAKRWAAKFWPERFSGPGPEVFKDRSRCTATVDDICEFRLGIPQRKRVVDKQAVYARMGITMFMARKLGGLKNLGTVLPPEQWAKATNVEEESYMLNYLGQQLQVNLRACLSYRRAPDNQYHGSSTKTEWDNVLYIFMANAAGKSHLVRNCCAADDLDELWTEQYGVFRENYEVARPTSTFTNVTKVMRDILCQCAMSRGVLLGQIEPKVVEMAFHELGWPRKLAFYDPGEGVRAKRMTGRGWDPDKVTRRLRRAEEFYSQARQLGWEELKGVEGVLGAIERHRCEREQSLKFHGGEDKVPKRHMEYVFDRTELVTRQLKIAEEERAAGQEWTIITA